MDKAEAAPEAAGLDAVMTGISIVAKDDREAIEKARPVYDAFYTNCKMKLLREKYKTEIEKMDRKERRQFLRKKLM
jgi:diphthamide biosynthesis methyltransferase